MRKTGKPYLFRGDRLDALSDFNITNDYGEARPTSPLTPAKKASKACLFCHGVNAYSKPYCHACKGESLAVAPDGTIYPCAQAIGDPELAAGTVHEVHWARLQSAFGHQKLTGPCHGCPLMGRCPGDCPSRLRSLPPGEMAAVCVIYQCIAELEQS